MSSSLEQLKATGTVVVCDSGKSRRSSMHIVNPPLTNPSLQVTSPVCILSTLVQIICHLVASIIVDKLYIVKVISTNV